MDFYMKALEDAGAALLTLVPGPASDLPLDYQRGINDATVCLQILRLNRALPTDTDRIAALLAQIKKKQSPS